VGPANRALPSRAVHWCVGRRPQGQNDVRWDLIDYRLQGVQPPGYLILRLHTLRAPRQVEMLSSSTLGAAKLNAQAHNYVIGPLTSPRYPAEGTQCLPRVRRQEMKERVPS
jgi:hypothetical protein